jgi:hypothetical protein
MTVSCPLTGTASGSESSEPLLGQPPTRRAVAALHYGVSSSLRVNCSESPY